MSSTWALLVEETRGSRERFWASRVLGQVEGTREEAMTVLRAEALQFKPKHPKSVLRRRLFQDADGFLMLLEGATQDFHCRFTLSELVYDTDAPPSHA
ncbi:hypothetical protein LHJ74_15365 [Streptomyces sp. N2-109]|uniref:Uncharacterized protein n=1 Tax=Streptomyces gossypii TaxID=2883101 RepID=A0ABT2JTQ1_9ACTN|nr:hypothetical protein [Streptomyces gossypii]MCT2591268.1 hypothetical protein [Streptomyces gossypii]